MEWKIDDSLPYNGEFKNYFYFEKNHWRTLFAFKNIKVSVPQAENYVTKIFQAVSENTYIILPNYFFPPYKLLDTRSG